MTSITTLTAAAAIAAAVPTASSAAILDFSGSVAATALVNPNAGCAPLPFLGLATGTGTSSLGNFAYSHTVCTQGATGPVTGNFLADFGADQLAGLLNGGSVATATPGIFDQAFTFTITGGTGRFQGATGAFNSIGQVDARSRPSQISFAFAGLVNAPAVPEPGTWAMMLVGFLLVGSTLRRRNGGGRRLLQVG